MLDWVGADQDELGEIFMSNMVNQRTIPKDILASLIRQ
jgi:hypothetical protein